MDRHPVAISVATGSLTSSILWAIRDLLLHPRVADIPLDFVTNSCPVAEVPSVAEVPLNFWTGLAVGLVCWPLLEFLVLLKQWLILLLRARISRLSGEGRLYKVLG